MLNTTTATWTIWSFLGSSKQALHRLKQAVERYLAEELKPAAKG